MAVDPKLREQIEAEITRHGDVTPRNMMGTTSYIVRNRMFAFWVTDGLVAKLPDQARQQFIDRKLGVLFQGPQGRGFGEWTRLHLEKQDDVAPAVEGVKKAYEYVKGSAAGVAKARKKKGKTK
jgi:hypothetical protein